MRRLIFTPALAFRISLLLFAILIYGTTAFLYFELPQNPDLSWSDGLWYSIVTMTTVGYGDFFPKTNAGRLFVGVPLMLIGIGLLGYTLSVIATALVTEKNKEMKGMSSFNFKDHLVIINFPNIAKVERILSELRNDPAFGKDKKAVLIDENLAEIPPELMSRQVYFVKGNPARDETLARASIDNASHAVVLSKKPGDPHSDSINIAVTLAIEARNGKITTVVECVDPETEELLKKAGCDRVVCLSKFDAYFVGQELLNPGVQNVINELLSSSEGQQLYLTDLIMKDNATFSSLAAAASRQGHLAIGIKRCGNILLNIEEGFGLLKDDQAVTIGAKRPQNFVTP